jgi:hypothetical protein
VKALAVTVGNLNLGVVTSFNFAFKKCFDDVDLPAMRGSGTHDMGMLGTEMELQGVLSGSSRFDDFMELLRAQGLGESVPLDSDIIQTVVFLRDVKLAKVGLNFIIYGLTLKESLFKQVNACDAITCWFTSTENAVVEVASASPLPIEGKGCIKVSHDAEAAEEVNVYYEPVDRFSLEEFDWVSFAFQISSKSNVTSAIVTVTDGLSNASYNFTSLLPEAGKWRRLRIHKTWFSNYDAVDWSQLSRIKFAVAKSQAQNYFFAVDDVGGYE